MNIINPKDLTIINSLPPVAKRGDKVSVDSEFFNQEKSRLHRAHGDFAWLGCSFDGVTVYYITDENQIQEFFDRLDAGVLIFHHTKYDLTQLRRYAKIPNRKLLWDTMLIEQIMFSGYYNDFGLAHLVRRYLNIYMSKEVRSEFSELPDVESVSSDSEYLEYQKTRYVNTKQVEYASVDVVATWMVYQEQRKIIDETDLEIWKSIELPFLWTLLSMGGIRLDTEKWIALAESNEKKAQEIKNKYPDMNLNSVPQVKNYFKTQYWITAKSTDVDFLESHPENEFARDMLVYRTFSKRSGTYGRKFIEDYVEADGKIYADMFQIGAETARTSCRAPNLQNQPHETAYRECFVPDVGNCLIVADYGSQEPRIAAYLSGDEGLINALNGSEKLYVAIARDVLGKTITKDSHEYTHIKSTVLGIFYGMSARGLASRIGVEEDEAQHMIDAFLEAYPGVRDYMIRQKHAQEYVTSIYGRKIWLNKYSYQWERNALNAPIQSSAADATKLAVSRFNQGILDAYINDGSEFEWEVLLIVHDEIVISVPEDECDFAQKILENCMVEVAEEMHDGIKGVAELYSGSSWACKS